MAPDNRTIEIIGIVIIIIICIAIIANHSSHEHYANDVNSANSTDPIIVQKGLMRPVAIDLCEDGTLRTCYGQNSSTPYTIADFGCYAPDDTSEPAFLGAFGMTNSQAVVLYGLSPPESVYWSFVPYLYQYPTCGKTSLFASISDSFKMTDITYGSIYNRPMAVIYSCNSCLIEKLQCMYSSQGYFTYVNAIPQFPDDSEYFILGRVSGFVTDQLREQYLENPNIYLTKYEDNTCMNTNLIKTVTLKPRSCIGTEYDHQELTLYNQASNVFFAAFTRLFPLYTHTLPGTVNRFRQDIGYDSGFDCINSCTECLGDNRDTVYSICIVERYFAISDVLLMFGVNHNVTGKSLFTQIGIYDVIKQFGVKSFDIFDKNKPFYAIIVSKVPLNIDFLQQYLGNQVSVYFYQLPTDVLIVALTERAYIQVLGNPEISASPSTLIPPVVEIRSIDSFDRRPVVENLQNLQMLV
jgi:hypothetical protein